MYDVILQAGILIALGVVWRLVRPEGLDADTVRRSLTGVVYRILLPALVLRVLWLAPLGSDALRVALLAAVGVVAGIAMARTWFCLHALPSAQLGALLLAAGFPNATYLGLPLLVAALGDWAGSIAIQYDLFACTPLLLTVGILIASHFGEGNPGRRVIIDLFKVPPLWAAVIAVVLNLSAVALPHFVDTLLNMLATGVVPLMLFSLGLSLRWSPRWSGEIVKVAPVVVIQLLLTPLLIWWLSGPIGLQGEVRTAVVLEAATPSMVLGIVLCDRFRLDTSIYAIAVTLTTALSMITLPLWFEWSAG